MTTPSSFTDFGGVYEDATSSMIEANNATITNLISAISENHIHGGRVLIEGVFHHGIPFTLPGVFWGSARTKVFVTFLSRATRWARANWSAIPARVRRFSSTINTRPTMRQKRRGPAFGIS